MLSDSIPEVQADVPSLLAASMSRPVIEDAEGCICKSVPTKKSLNLHFRKQCIPMWNISSISSILEREGFLYFVDSARWQCHSNVLSTPTLAPAD